MTKLLLSTILTVAVAAAQTAPSKPAATKTAAAKSDRLPQLTDLKFPPLREVKLPEVTTFTLPNGIRVYMLANHELPLVNGTAIVRTGNLFDPADKVGLAALTGTVMRSGGTKTKTGDQLDEVLENMAASVEASIGETTGSVSFSALKENTDEVLAIFKEVLTAPEFRQDKLDLAKTQTKSAIARRNDEADNIADREFASIVYGRNNAYGWDMTYEHADNIKREDLISFYQRYFFPSNVMLSVYGDFSPAEMRTKLEKLFADWNVKQAPVPPFPAVQPQTTAPGVYQATKTDVTQAFFQVGHLGGVLKDKDYPALSVMSDILGGGFSSRLFTNVRTKQGLAYNVGGGWGANYSHPGLFRIAGSTKAESTVDALQAIRKEIEGIRTAEVTDQELATARQSVLNSFVFYFDHPRKILNRYVTYEYWGYPKDFIFQYQKAVEATTKADVLRVAKEHLHPDRLSVLAVGNPKDFGKPLSALGAVKELDINLPEPKREAPKTDSASLAKGKQLLARAQQAMGGADKLAAVKDATLTSEMKRVSGPGAGMTVNQVTEYIAPDTMRATQTFPFGKVIVFWDGKEGWLSSPQGTMALPPPVAKQMQGEMLRSYFRLYLSDRDPERTVTAIADSAVEISNKAGDRVQVEFDPSTGLPSKYSYESMATHGEPAKVVTTFSDWTETGGIKFPRAAVLEQNGEKVGEVKFVDAKVNTGLSAQELAKKP